MLAGTLVRIDPETAKVGRATPSPPVRSERARILGSASATPCVSFQCPARRHLPRQRRRLRYEEIDRIPLGAPLYNSGWPCYEGLGRNHDFETLDLNACNRLYEAPDSTEPPFFYFSHTSPVVPGDTCPRNYGSAISGQAFYEGSTYPSEYDNALFFADSVHGCIYMMPAGAEGEPNPAAAKPFLNESDKTYPGVDIEQGPERSIWYADLGLGTINRITYDPGAPVAKLKTVGNPWGPVGTTFELDASERIRRG